MSRVTDPIVRPISRVGAAAQNALELARFGGLATDQEPSPYEVAREHRIYRLRHYYPGPTGQNGRAVGPPVVLVPPMMLAAEVYDVAPNTSAVTILREHGIDPWVVDFGAPEHERGGLERTLTDHVLAVSDAVDSVREATGRDVHLGGYSQGGMFCYQAAAYRRNAGIGSLITFGSPVDTRQRHAARAARGGGVGARRPPDPGLPRPVAARVGEPDRLSGCSIPSSRCASRCSSYLQLHDREALLPARVSGGSWSGRAGWRGPGRRWPSSCASSSPRTGCSRAGS